MSMAEPIEKPLSALGILGEALILPKNNKKLILQVFLISLFTSCVLVFGFRPYIYESFFMDLIPFGTFFRTGCGPVYLYSILAFPIRAFVKAILIHAAAATYTKQMPASAIHKNSSCSRIMVANTSMGVLLTQLMVALWCVICYLLPVLFICEILGEGARMYAVPSNAYIFKILLVGSPLSVILYVLEITWLLYLATLWALSVSVSVLEQGRYGLGAIRRAMQLVQRRRLRGFAIVLALFAPYEVWTMWYALTDDRTCRHPRPLAVFAETVVLEVLNVYAWSAYTIYYYECKRRLANSEVPDVRKPLCPSPAV